MCFDGGFFGIGRGSTLVARFQCLLGHLRPGAVTVRAGVRAPGSLLSGLGRPDQEIDRVSWGSFVLVGVVHRTNGLEQRARGHVELYHRRSDGVARAVLVGKHGDCLALGTPEWRVPGHPGPDELLSRSLEIPLAERALQILQENSLACTEIPLISGCCIKPIHIFMKCQWERAEDRRYFIE